MTPARAYTPDERLLLARRIAFAHYPAVNIGTAKRLEALGLPVERFFDKDPHALVQISGIKPRVVQAIRDDAMLKRADAEVDFIEENRIRPLWFTDNDYPALLRECADAPAMLYMLGTPPQPQHKCIAIVGTRHCTPYGHSFIARLVADLASSINDVMIVSGLAIGADIAAHRAAMKEGLPTGAVMAEGLNHVYPAEHRSDAVRIIRDGGFMLSQYLSSDPTHRGHFLARNRIVAGICHATVIVESDIRGGAMTTAHLASDYHREVLALPGRVTDQYSRGCNSLIADNTARIIRDAGDLLDAMGWTATAKNGIQTSLEPELSAPQKILLQFMQSHPEATANDIAFAMELPVNEISARLFELEMDGWINSIAGGRYMVTLPSR